MTCPLPGTQPRKRSERNHSPSGRYIYTIRLRSRSDTETERHTVSLSYPYPTSIASHRPTHPPKKPSWALSTMKSTLYTSKGLASWGRKRTVLEQALDWCPPTHLAL